MNCDIGIVGCGLIGFYIFFELVLCWYFLNIIVFDKGEWVGVGIFYLWDGVNWLMFVNIVSIEIFVLK